MGTNDYQTLAVYAPAASGVIHQTPRDRSEIDPERQGTDKWAFKPTEIPKFQAVHKVDGGAESGLESKSERSPVPDPASLVQAQELARKTDKSEPTAVEKRSAVASPSEMVGVAEDLVRLDQNGDGRIDQLELRHSLRAEAGDTTYAALSNYRKAMGFGTAVEEKEKPAEEPKKLFAEETDEAVEGGTGDSSDTTSKSENNVEIVV